MLLCNKQKNRGEAMDLLDQIMLNPSVLQEWVDLCVETLSNSDLSEQDLGEETAYLENGGLVISCKVGNKTIRMPVPKDKWAWMQ